MTTIVTRAGKGSPLTNAEVDANFTNLNSAKLEANQLITLSGDASGSGTTAIAVTLANSGVTAGSYGSSTSVPVITVDAKGRVTGVTTSAISGSLTFTGDVTGSGSTGSSTALTLANSGVTAGTYTKVTVDAKGRVTTGASLASSDVTTALGFTPYDSTNPSGYIGTAGARAAISVSGSLSYNSTTGVISFSDAVTSVFGRTGAVTLQSSDVTGALGYTPYNSTNPSGYVTSSGSVNYANTAGSSNLANAKWQSAAIAGSQGSNVSAVEVRNNGGTGDSNLANITFHCQGYYGTSLHLRPDGYFGVGGWSASSWRWYVNLGNGDMVAAGNVTAYSDERLKKDWGTLPDDFVEQLAAVKHGTYTRIDSGARQVGVSAQSLQGLLPEAVGLAEDGDTLQVAYGNAALVAAVQLAQKLLHTCDRVAQLEAKLAKIAGEG